MKPTYDFTGQVALVTGAGSGIGFATAQEFAKSGAAVVLVDVDETLVTVRARELSEAGFTAIGVGCDVANEDEVAAAVKVAVDTYGRLDMAFNSAGIIDPPAEIADVTAENYDRVNNVNARGMWACMKHELRQMRKQGSGAIVNCSSLSGLVGGAGRTSYHASKHAVIGLTTSAALEYAPRGIRINVVCPGTIETPMVSKLVDKGELVLSDAIAKAPIARIGQPEEIASAVLWLCSPGASYVVGVALPVDGGYVAQ
ncbi:NAD(P)-dependent dehydrogenase (short-subunit alcohol dehydrogenase family) [Rhizobium leguminosarum]